MTTAHRATWKPTIGTAVGGSYKGGIGHSFSSKSLPAHTKLKFRKIGQENPEEISKKDLKKDLEARERIHKEEKGLLIGEEEEEGEDALGDDASSRKRKRKLLRDIPESAVKEIRASEEDIAAAEHFDDSDDTASSSDSDGSGSESDSDDEEALLLELELQKIKKEREELRKKKEAEEAAEERDSMLSGNPLIDPSRPNAAPGKAVLARRWDDDVVFRNQARDEPKTKKRFVNDTIRNDFHRKFLSKYIK
eukprot:g234.t1